MKKKIPILAIIAILVFSCTTFAADKSIYVLTKINFKGKSYSVSYNKNGLVTEINMGSTKYKYYYDKNNLIREIVDMGNIKIYTDYTYGSNGQWQSSKMTSNYGGGITTKYTYNSKRLITKAVMQDTNGRTENRSYNYNKKGYPTKMTHKGKDLSYTIKRSFDKKGILTKVVKTIIKGNASNSTETIKNKYDRRGLLSSTESSIDGKISYSYKNIKAKESLLDQIKEQQWWITNFSLLYSIY